ncbi:MAG: DMT family transporter [Acidovorax sp.]|nr:DMT family transporter [Acidovorax sp.]
MPSSHPHGAATPAHHYAFPLLAVLIWSGNTVVSKMAAGAIGPAEIGFYRWLLAALLLTPLALRPALRNGPAIRAQAGRIVVLGLLGMVVYQSLAYYAAYLTSATHMGIIGSLTPMMVLALSIPLLGQPLTAGAVAGSVLSIAGVVLVVTGGHPGSLLAGGVGAGDGLMLLAMFAYAVYAVLLKRWGMQGVPPLQLMYLQVLVATVALLPLYLLSARTGLTRTNLPMVLYAGVFASVFAPWCWMRAVTHLGPGRSSMCFNLIPLLTALIAAALLGEHLAIYHLFGGLLTVGGVMLGELWKTPLPAQPARA